MLYNIQVFNRGAIEALSPQENPHAFISIVSSPDDKARLPINDKTEAVLRLYFHDIDQPTNNLVLFEASIAHQIWEFLSDLPPDVVDILINCDAGNSRSAAVAAAITKALGGDDSEYFKLKNPNRKVFRILLEVFYDFYEPTFSS
jgi:predicted protein tyrosine phosphatase